MNEYILKRFNGINKLYGENSLSVLQNKHICVIGIGGVGSWAIECLVRSGIGKLTLIDFDQVALSNTNRQIHAIQNNYGKSKIQAMYERINTINQYCEVRLIEEFITTENIHLIAGFDYIIDATDDITAKLAISLYCIKNELAFLICGAAGGKTNALQLKIDKLSNVQHDRLLAKLRYILRKKYNFSTKININCIYSNEAKVLNTLNTPQTCTNGLSCDGYGSAVGITASMGFIAAQYVINQVILE